MRTTDRRNSLGVMIVEDELVPREEIPHEELLARYSGLKSLRS